MPDPTPRFPVNTVTLPTSPIYGNLPVFYDADKRCLQVGDELLPPQRKD